MSENETAVYGGGQGQAGPSTGESPQTAGGDGLAADDVGLMLGEGVSLTEGEIAPRTLRRMRAWKWGGGAVVILLALWCAAMFLLPRWARMAYDSDPETSAGRYRLAMNITPSFLQGWEARFNLGTALAKGKKYSEAVGSLSIALDRAPKSKRTGSQIAETDGPECKVRRNLSLAYEKRGDQSKGAGRKNAAKKDYAKASSTMAPCSKNNDKNKQSKDRQDKKANPPSPSPTQNPSQSPGQNPSQNPSQSPGQNPSQSPGQNPSQNPSQDPGQSPSQSPGQNPSQSPSQSQSPNSPGQDPNQNPGGASPTPAPPSNDPKTDEKESKLKERNRKGDEEARRKRNGGGYKVDW